MVEKDAEEKALRQLIEILLSSIIIVARFSIAFVLYNGLVTQMLGAPPMTIWQAVGIWLFIKCVFGFK